jgi:hypothetical protein
MAGQYGHGLVWTGSMVMPEGLTGLDLAIRLRERTPAMARRGDEPPARSNRWEKKLYSAIPGSDASDFDG